MWDFLNCFVSIMQFWSILITNVYSQVLGKFNTVVDLPAADACYHNVCAMNSKAGYRKPKKFDSTVTPHPSMEAEVCFFIALHGRLDHHTRTYVPVMLHFCQRIHHVRLYLLDPIVIQQKAWFTKYEGEIQLLWHHIRVLYCTNCKKSHSFCLTLATSRDSSTVSLNI